MTEQSTLLVALRGGLQQRSAEALRRALAAPTGVDLSSNDYLGYASDPVLTRHLAERIAAHGLGSGSSRLVRGHTSLIAELEPRLAHMCDAEAALLFPSGYQANLGLMATLAGAEDTIFSDAHNHASLIDGIRLSHAARHIYPHQDLDALARSLSAAPHGGRRYIVTESVFSMDGDLTPLVELCDLAERHRALVVVDEAHATGLYGPTGGGRVSALGLRSRVLATVHTGGKALGVGGAWIAGPRTLVEHLVDHCRSFIYSTAPVPAIAIGLDLAMTRRAADGASVDALHARADRFRAHLRRAGYSVGPSGSPIVPIRLGSSERALEVAGALRDAGFGVTAIRPPTVPENTARLRVTVRAPIHEDTLDRFRAQLALALGPPRPLPRRDVHGRTWERTP